MNNVKCRHTHIEYVKIIAFPLHECPSLHYTYIACLVLQQFFLQCYMLLTLTTFSPSVCPFSAGTISEGTGKCNIESTASQLVSYNYC